MKLKNILAVGLIAAGMGFGATSCIDDLDRKPSDSRSLSWATVESDPDTYLPQVLAKCYSVLAVSGQDGAGSSDLSGLDNGTGCYSRAIYMLNEFPTDEALWIWNDAGVIDLTTGTWGNGNINIYGTYSRLYVAIAICNDFIRNMQSSGIDFTAPTAQNSAKQYILEARALRALSYWYVLDLFGNGGWVDETMPYGESPKPIVRKDLYNKLVGELTSIINEWPDDLQPLYGRIGKDAVKTLLAKVYLNAGVYTNGEVNAYADCYTLCSEIINAHKGAGFKGTGLAENYLGLFSANNDRYMPGGSGVNEIIWGVPYDGVYTQAYGGTTFLIAASVTSSGENDTYTMNSQDLGAVNFNWKCMHARKEFSDKFTENGDKRDDLWYKEANGFTKDNTTFSDFASGYAPIKFTNIETNDDGTYAYADPTKGTSPANFTQAAKEKGNAKNFADTDLPIFRLADVYLMRAECSVLGGQPHMDEAIEDVNNVRERAGCTRWTSLTADGLLDERARELYWENHRRTDLIRFGKWISGYNWSWKRNVAEGTDFGSYQNVYPIPANVIAAQPEFAAIQNPGY